MSLIQTIRIVGDLIPGRNLIDLNTETYPYFWSGNKIRFLIALENSSQFLADFSNLESLTLQIRPSTGNSSPVKGSDPVMSATVTDFNENLTQEEWDSEEFGHVEICFDSGLSAIPAGQYWISITAITNDSLYNITFGAGPVRVIESGYSSSALMAEASGFAWSRDESDLRYVKRETTFQDRKSRELLKEAIPLLSLASVERNSTAYNPASKDYVEADILRTKRFGDGFLRLGLIEEQRENLIPYSQLLGQWNLTGNLLIEDSFGIAPDKTLSGAHVFGSSGALTYTLLGLEAGDYAFSFYSQKGYVIVRVSSGENVLMESPYESGDSWIRQSLRFSLEDGGDLEIRLLPVAESIDIELWGMQLEAGLFETSYIPTEGVSAVRYADEITVDLSFLSDSCLVEGEGTLLVLCKGYRSPESQLMMSSANVLFHVGKLFVDYETDEDAYYSKLIWDDFSGDIVLGQIYAQGGVVAYGDGTFGESCNYSSEYQESTCCFGIDESHSPNCWVLPLYWSTALDKESLELLNNYFSEEMKGDI